ncbi:hypothetical protein Q8F55_001682 [Vanrija albida]|uniref:Uncharacterized protein n=1 Tax=Vanrija albida TaxID=181172 RepID=A0ABR3Q7M1_9TREE
MSGSTFSADCSFNIIMETPAPTPPLTPDYSIDNSIGSLESDLLDIIGDFDKNIKVGTNHAGITIATDVAVGSSQDEPEEHMAFSLLTPAVVVKLAYKFEYMTEDLMSLTCDIAYLEDINSRRFWSPKKCIYYQHHISVLRIIVDQMSKKLKKYQASVGMFPVATPNELVRHKVGIWRAITFDIGRAVEETTQRVEWTRKSMIVIEHSVRIFTEAGAGQV